MSVNTDYVPVCLSGNLTISNIDRIYSELSAALNQESPVILDIGDVTETDLAFVQLVEAARRQAATSGRSLVLSRPADGAVLEVLRRGGFLDDGRRDRAAFWLQEDFQ